MNAPRIGAILLIAGGALGLAYAGGHLDPDLSAGDGWWEDGDTVIVPVWAGLVGIAAGAAVLFTRRPFESGARSSPSADHANQADAA